ncbi:MAG TPA: type II secretion system protein [Thermoanaerobaculia bacterium]|jgi:general secretion pathway protein G|nr:type II secretion system protein [Thermoanaerobaculia bacterium]
MPYCAYCGSDVRDPARFNCPSCGNPHSGAPPAAIGTARADSSVGLVVGLVIGGFVVLAIMGILAAIAVPNLLTAMQRSKQKRTMADMRSLATALEARATDTNDYPQVTTPLELGAILTPTYIKIIPAKDGWSHPVRYECWDAHSSGKCDSYAIGSGAKDGLFEHESLRAYEEASPTNFDCDLVFSNGKFVQHPEGIANQ